MKRFQAAVGALVIVLATSAAKPGGAENVLRWASATEALTFDPSLGQSLSDDRREPSGL